METTARPIINADLKFKQLFINNEFVNSQTGKTLPVINPATGKKITEISEADRPDVDRAVEAATKAFRVGSHWRSMDASQRARLIHKLCDLMERDRVLLASLECMDTGKPFQVVFNHDLPLAIECLRYYAGFADKITGKTLPVDGDKFCYTREEPVGVCGLLLPFTMPIVMMAVKLAPALATGCTVVMVPSEDTPLTVMHTAALIKEVCFPAGVINILPGREDTLRELISRHPKINKISFTGTTDVGKMVKREAATNLKRINMELGGKSPFIVLPDCDLQEAAHLTHLSHFEHMGQGRTVGHRTFVHADVYDKFIDLTKDLAKKRIIGDPFETKTMTGPQINEREMNRVLEHIETGKREGARLVHGGKRHGSTGYFVEPTIFTDVKDNMKLATDEVTGPIQTITKFTTVEDVIRQINEMEWGLKTTLFTKNIETAMMLSHAIRTGTVMVNCWEDFKPQAPWGGMKMSGFGREMGPHGLKPFIETKTVMVKLPQKLC